MNQQLLFEYRESETAAMMSWTAENNFVLSLVLEDGTVGITYPFHQRFLMDCSYFY